ncbi:hypothetical protein D9Q98_005128 [Chlorella vulgaris]|uniref:F-box domain-containing protein n=1 Tax=Chlorella vulgaris TaxID=3077 RepID=A0A9D4TNP8_CHLVU|nr:hypothetical protein D9Q98_005128 [Chlorella vulgaris]
MALKKDEKGAAPGPHGGSVTKKQRKASVIILPPSLLHTHLQSRQLQQQLRLRPADGPSSSAQSARAVLSTRSATAAPSPSCLRGVPPAYVPVRTLPLIFAQRKRHLQQQKARAQHRGPYEERAGDGLLALPEDVLLKVVCFLAHDELKPLFRVCKALHATMHNAIFYHFNYSTPHRPTEEPAPPALGERQRRPARTNVQQVMSRLARGARVPAAGRGAAASGAVRAAAPRALNFTDSNHTDRK